MIETAGVLHSFGAFKDSELVGFITIIATVLPHYGVLVPVSESFFVAKEYRKTGAGTKLLRTAEEFASSIGAKGLIISAPTGGSLDQALSNPKSGYQNTNRAFFRRLCD